MGTWMLIIIDIKNKWKFLLRHLVNLILQNFDLRKRNFPYYQNSICFFFCFSVNNFTYILCKTDETEVF